MLDLRTKIVSHTEVSVLVALVSLSETVSLCG